MVAVGSNVADRTLFDPAKKIRTDFVTVDLVEHFVSSTSVEIVGDITDTRRPIALYKDGHSFQLLADRIIVSRKYIDRQIVRTLTKTDRIGQPGGGAEE